LEVFVRRVLTVAVAATAGVALAGMAYASPQPAAQTTSKPASVRTCDQTPAPGYAACDSWRRTDVNGSVVAANAKPAATTPTGYGPSNLLSAYNLASAAASDGAGVTIGIVDAYDDPNAYSDVNVYRSQYGIPSLASCTPTTVKSSSTPCFAKSSQTGTTSYPKKDGGWAQEESLDIDMASAICPKCNILLVEASSSSYANLGSAVNEAVSLGAKVVSNSYGGSESSSVSSYETSYYKHPGVTITASSGDGGYGVEFPASSQYVVAVGGTSLNTASNSRGWSETVWSGAGSGCSAYITKPSWQTDSGCGKRTVADVSAVADPNTGVAVYDSTSYQGYVGWMEFGGTSVASPIIASVYALANNSSSLTYGSSLYSHTSSLYDVTSGSNGSCGGSYLCTGTTGYDGPTGLGTPDGLGAF
jgi:subtilase family serine protease